MDNKLNNAMNEIDEGLIEEAAHAGRAERNGLKLARNIGLSVCGVAAAAAALTFGINHHLASLPEKVDLLPAESQEANSDISDAIMEGALRELPVEMVEVEDVDPARLSQSEPYFIDAGNQWLQFDNDGSLLSRGNTIIIMDCGGYWVEYDATADEGFFYELLDVRSALVKAENVLEASLTDLRMGTCNTIDYDANGSYFRVTAQFDNGKCLHYSLSCDTNHEQWTMKLLSDKADYTDNTNLYHTFFHEEKAGVYDAVRFNDLSGAYICDNNGDIRVVKYTPDGYFGYLPFGGKEDIYIIQNSETGSIRRYCVKENGDAISTTDDFLTVIGEVEHQEDIHNIVLPSWNIVDDEIAAPLSELGASERYHLSFAPDYDGLALSFFIDKDGKVFLYDFSWLYPCTVTKGESEYEYEIKVYFYPEGRETPENGSYLTEVPMRMLIDGDTWTLAGNYELFIDEQGETKRITLYKGTEFTPHGGGMIIDGDPDSSESEEALKNLAIEAEQHEQNKLLAAKAEAANQRVMEEILAAQIENGEIEIYHIDELICPVNDTQAKINAYYGYDDWTTVTHYGIDIGDTGGAEIYAAQSGTVIIADTDDYYGNYVVIDHGDGFATLYAHCSDITVNEGQTVYQGGIIGRIGATGSFTTGDCLHFEVRRNGTALDPVNYLAIPTEDNGGGNISMTAEKQQELNDHWAELIASVSDPDFVYPVGGDYAIVEHMYGHTPDSGYYAHYGIDIGVGRGEPVLAAADGEVILAQWYYGYGNCVMIQHDNGVVTVYGHCEKLYVSRGDTVTRGQAIATAGASGQATAPNLHFEVRINDENVDPTLFQYRIQMNGELSEPTTFD